MDNVKPNPDAKTILIVEDEIIIAITLQDALEEAGYHVLDLTGRHQEALTAARECKPALALVNIQLQGRDDGIALADDLHKIGVPVLFISGQQSRARSAQTVAVGSLPKPYSPDDMVKAVDYLLGQLAGGAAASPPGRLEVFEPPGTQAA
jgi:two-component system, response regulator PdtaR